MIKSLTQFYQGSFHILSNACFSPRLCSCSEISGLDFYMVTRPRTPGHVVLLVCVYVARCAHTDSDVSVCVCIVEGLGITVTLL